ncbi:MAG: hypothetical protein KA054_02335 [Candidatus Moranbacteria bacterium]|nr:hypothetical protein [Candidatus Moranbacteria bacterium]
MNIITEVIGFLAAVVGTSLMLPQVIKTVKMKRADEVSLVMLILYFLNCLLWLIYGVLIWAIPLAICNAIALAISMIQLFLKFRYDKRT